MGYKARFKYDDKEWLVIDAFEYNGDKYMYLVEDIKVDIQKEEDIAKYQDQIRTMYVKSVGNDDYEEIVDPTLISELNLIVTKDALSNKL